MTEHCMINGKRCSKCCEVLTIRLTKNFNDWRKYVRRYGYPSDYNGEKVHSMLRPISKRRAKKLNPHLVKIVGSKSNYWTCKHFTGSGCGDYENRPRMCSDYPYYGRTEKEWVESPEYKIGGLYHINCTFFT